MASSPWRPAAATLREEAAAGAPRAEEDQPLRPLRGQVATCARDLTAVRQEVLALRRQWQASAREIGEQVNTANVQICRRQEDLADGVWARLDALQGRVEQLEQPREGGGRAGGRAAAPEEEGLARAAEESLQRVGAVERGLAALGEEHAGLGRALREAREQAERRLDDLDRRADESLRSSDGLERALGALAERLLGESPERMSQLEERLRCLDSALEDTVEQIAQDRGRLEALEGRVGEQAARHEGLAAELQAEQGKHLQEAKDAHASLANLANVTLTLDAYHSSLREQVVRLEESVVKRFEASSRADDEASSLREQVVRLEESVAKRFEASSRASDGASSLWEKVVRLEESVANRFASSSRAHDEAGEALEALQARIATDAMEQLAAVAELRDTFVDQSEATLVELRARVESVERCLHESLAKQEDCLAAMQAADASARAATRALEATAARDGVAALGARLERLEAAQSVQSAAAHEGAALGARLERLEGAHLEVRLVKLERARAESGLCRAAEELTSTAASEVLVGSLADLRSLASEAAALDVCRTSLQERVDRVEQLLGVAQQGHCGGPPPADARSADAAATRCLSSCLERLIQDLDAVRGGHRGLTGQAAAQSRLLDEALSQLRQERATREAGLDAAASRLSRVELALAEVAKPTAALQAPAGPAAAPPAAALAALPGPRAWGNGRDTAATA